MPRKKAKSSKPTSSIAVSNDTDSLWKTHPEAIKQFLEKQPDYARLCGEVAYILEKRLHNQNLEIAMVVNRAKSLQSFLEKLQRKQYESPFNEIPDFAGVRVVCLYASDLKRIEAVIRKEFDVLEKVDKYTEMLPNEFGYGAVHFVVKLGVQSIGARYDDLRELKCEIQTRTVLQDAWAVIDHHLVYKRESDIPKPIQRKLNSLAGLFETADDQFDRVRTERENYLAELTEIKGDESTFLSTEINRDSLVSYVEWKFPESTFEDKSFVSDQLSMLLSAIDEENYKNLKSIDEAISPLLKYLDTVKSSLTYTDEADSPVLNLTILLALVDASVRSATLATKNIAALENLNKELGLN